MLMTFLLESFFFHLLAPDSFPSDGQDIMQKGTDAPEPFLLRNLGMFRPADLAHGAGHRHVADGASLAPLGARQAHSAPVIRSPAWILAAHS
jgi:hypothetical protein